MRATSLTFGPSRRAPSLSGHGVAIAVSGGPRGPSSILVEGIIRLEKALLPDGPEALVGGAFLVAVHAQSHRPEVLPLLGERILAPGDVRDLGADYAASFQCALDLSAGPVGPFFLHATCFQYVSNVVYVPGRP